MITNLVFSGAGLKIYVFIGVIKFLKEKDLLKNIKALIGTSAGAIISLALCLGYEYNEIEELMLKLQVDNLKNISTNNIINFFNTYGIDNGDNFKKLFNIILRIKTNNENITFKELYEKTNKSLTITATCVNSMEAIYFNHINTPDCKVCEALLMSISIPFLFTPCNYEKKMYLDGGLTNNYPIEFFKEEIKNTLGILVHSSINKCYEINNIEDYISSILFSSMYKLVRNTYNDYIENTILIEHNFNFFDFNLSKDKKKELIKIGYDKTKDFIESEKFKETFDL